MKTLSTSIVGATLLISGTGVHAAEPFTFSANVALTSDYVWRGVSQTYEDPAIQGGFDVSHESGVYAGIWGSNVRFDEESEDGGYSGAHVELDYTVGYGMELSDDLSFDVNYARFTYPGTTDSDMGEITLGLTYSIATLSYSYAHDFPDYDSGYSDGDDGDDTSHYVELGLEYEVPETAFPITLGGSVGYYTYPDAPDDADMDYTNWMLSVGTSAQGFDFSLAYTDTDIENNNLSDGRAVFTISKSF